ncbi:MFS transporter [Hyphomonas johnsonii]|uniref:Major facilitator family transporter n=1 Tax=Hyphomonas johnsonii MHS-2 TaxID=1280950 RepID=A0A059FP79_9PROT|nr:MFS transporter [Hyphomonas johnsonii]KCZ92422.1 major facilitator family transporter [Hyphomonas johnsonii MHS-2]
MTDTERPLRPLTRLQQGMIALAMVAMGAGFTINFVVVAPLARQAGLSEIEVAGILTFSAVIYTVMIPVWGRIADRVGRKRVMVFSLFAMGLTNMAFLFALDAALSGLMTGMMTFFLLAFVRVWFGLLSPGLQPASMAAMTDATTTLTRAGGLGMLGAAMSVGSILGPAGAAVLAPFGALVPLWGTIVLNIGVGCILALVLPRSRDRVRESHRPKPLALMDARVLPHLVFLFVYFMAVGMIQQTVGWFIEDRYQFVDTPANSAGETAVLFTGIIFSCLAFSMIIIQFGYIAPRKPDPRRILPIGLALVAIGYVCADLFHPFWALCLSFLVVGTGAALAVPSANALGSLSVSRTEQGSAAALLAAAPPAGFIFGPLMGATLYSFTPSLPLIASASVVGVLAVYAFLVTSRRPLSP